MRKKVTMKDPMTCRWSPIHGYGRSSRKPVGCKCRLLFWQESVIAFSITCAVHAEVGAVHVHRVPPTANIDPAPMYRFARWVGQTLGVGPGLPVDHWNQMWKCLGLVPERVRFWSASPQAHHKNPIWGHFPRRINYERPRELTVLSQGTTEVKVSTGAPALA
jgi:hypothetical protein